MKTAATDFRKELKKLRSHRNGYYPAVKRIMGLYRDTAPADLPVELINDRDALIIMELIDVGYLDGDVLIIRKRFDDIAGLLYTGGYPLTESGEKFLEREERSLKGRIRALIDGIRGRR